MDLLQTAVDDVAVLIATGRALSEQPPDTDLGADEGRLRMQLRRAAGAYLDLLARRKHGVFDSEALAACRVAAEQQMPLALQAAPGLAAMMSQRSGALEGVTAARNDLLRLAHIAVHLRRGTAALRHAGVDLDEAETRKLVKRLRRNLRESLVAYARAGMRGPDDVSPMLREARRAAIKLLRTHCVDDIERLAEIEARTPNLNAPILGRISGALRDLTLDWAPQAS